MPDADPLSSVFLEGMGETTNSFSQSIQCPSQGSKETSSELKSDLIQFGPSFLE